jgi:drug/metabolite transporter (DMT)-like permease
LAALRTAFAAALVWGAFLSFWRREIRISLHGLAGCLAIGAVNGLGSLLFYTSLSRLDASSAALLNTLYPLWVVLFLFAAGQPLTALTLARLGLAMAGVYLLTRGGERFDWLGVTLMVASAAMYGWHLVLGQWVLADVPPRTATLYILTTMACVVGLVRGLQIRPLEPISAGGWGAVMSLGATTALSRLAIFAALSRVGGIETSLFGLIELLVSLLLAYALLGERLTGLQWAGGLLLIASTVLVAYDRGMQLAQGNEPVAWRTEHSG